MTAPMNPVPLTPAVAAGAPVEKELAFHMLKLAVPIAVVVVFLAAVICGANGAWSALLAVVIVVVNMLLVAITLTWAARISANMLMGVALVGFLVRMMLVTVVVWGVHDEPWVDLKTLAVAILVTQLALLAWESRYVRARSTSHPPLTSPPLTSRRRSPRDSRPRYRLPADQSPDRVADQDPLASTRSWS